MKDRREAQAALNVLGEPLVPCSVDPLTGFYRDGCCNTGYEDTGIHTVCVRVTAKFLDAVKRDDALAVALFVEGRGVNLAARDADGQSALEIARAKGNRQIVGLLGGGQ